MNYNREVHNYINIAKKKKNPQQQQVKQTTKTASSYKINFKNHAGFYQIPFYEEIWINLSLFWEEFLQDNCYQW